MDKKTLENYLQTLLTSSKKRNFVESIDLIVTFKNLNVKNKDHRFEYFLNLPHAFLSKIKTLVFVREKQFLESLKGIADKIISDENILKITKKEAKKLAQEFDLILAEGQTMLSVGKHLGQVLSPRGKMPSVMPATPQAVKNLIDSTLSKVKITNKKSKTSVSVLVKIGNKNQTPQQLSENAFAVITSLFEKLPNGKQNIKDIMFKTTMGAPVKVGGAL